MPAFLKLLLRNRNYRYTWIGQVISEVGDHFNNIAVFSLVMQMTNSGMAVSGVLLSRGVAVLAAGPLAGVVIDKLDRRQLMIASDLARTVIAMGFGLCLMYPKLWILYLFSFLLMFASPFFTVGRSAILPSIASKEELHTANSLTQTTQWTTMAIGTMLGGASVMQFGYELAFLLNALSFACSALCISKLALPGGFAPRVEALTEQQVVRPWHDYVEGLRYIRGVPLLMGLTLLTAGWASGGGAAQVLFTLFGDKVFQRGAAGIGIVWGVAAAGLVVGGAFAHWYGKRIRYETYLWTVAICYVLHGVTYVAFSQMRLFVMALLFIGMSRAAVGITSVLNTGQLLRHVSDGFRGRVFSTIESVSWATMMLSMTAAGIASDHYSPRTIGLVSGVLSGSTSIFWAWAVYKGKLPEPERSGLDPDDVEVHGDPNV
ncbi:MAG: MFS transporter [Acidobacteria bacterium]|nr:MFS transporter [Acidobacteriota bacterium]